MSSVLVFEESVALVFFDAGSPGSKVLASGTIEVGAGVAGGFLLFAEAMVVEMLGERELLCM